MKKYQIGNGFTHFSGVTIGNNAQIIFPFIQRQNNAIIKSNIKRITNPGSSSVSKEDITTVLDKVFSAENGARRDTPQTVLLFVNKNTDFYTVAQKLKTMKSSGINIVVIAVGDDVDKTKLTPLVDAKDQLFSLDDNIFDLLEPVVIQTLPGNSIQFLIHTLISSFVMQIWYHTVTNVSWKVWLNSYASILFETHF